ncbi:MAG TPA: DUF1653 domain-containing protein [Thermomicrobiaceae bacterium]|nr:DUF1653 domain-containing protein [Thermomicrobiaceae bacterium]
MNQDLRRGRYRHYKGKYYELLGLAMHSETEEKMVLYRPLYPCPDLAEEYGKDPWFVRPYDMFFGTVEHNGERVPRFAFVEPVDEPSLFPEKEPTSYCG